MGTPLPVFSYGFHLCRNIPHSIHSKTVSQLFEMELSPSILRQFRILVSSKVRRDPEVFHRCSISTQDEGFGTCLRTKESLSQAPIGSDGVESFLTDLEREVLSTLNRHGVIAKTVTTKEFRVVKERLRESENWVMVPTDKINSYQAFDQGSLKAQ